MDKLEIAKENSVSEGLEILKIKFNYYKTKTLLFRNITRSDSFPLFEATQNEEFNKYLSWEKPKTIEQTINKIEELMLDQNTIAISFSKKNGVWCGMFSFTKYKDGVMLSFWTHPEYWSKIYPIHAAFASIDILFKETKIKNIYAKISPYNERMIKVVTKNAFHLLEKTETLHDSGNLILADIYLLNNISWDENIKTFYIDNEKY